MKAPLYCRINGYNVRLLSPNLADRIVKQVATLGGFTGWERIDVNSLDDATREEIVAMIPALAKMVDPDDALAVNKQMNDLVITAGSRDAKARVDREAGIARLLEWSKSAGLEDTKLNSEHIQKWLVENCKGYLSASNINVAIDCLGPRGTNVLTWRKPEPAAPVASEQPKVELLPNGEPQLPLDASADQMRGASLTQLRDLSHRRGEGQQRPGWKSTRL